MKDFIITTETCSDFPKEYIQENNIRVIPLYYRLGDEVYQEESGQDYHEFYDKIRQGQMPQTIAANPESVEQCFRNILDKGYDILHIAFSSALSSTYNTVQMIGNQLQEEYPTRKIYVIDSKCASLGEGLLVHKAVCLKDQGKTIDEVKDWVENNYMHICHEFTVDDLSHLHRGGRVSKTTAIIGTLINVKPVMHVDDEGRLTPLYNVRGRKKSLTALVENMLAAIEGCMDNNDIIFISHGDCLEDAQFVADLVKQKTGIDKFLINPVGAVIGSHSGPGTVALFYYGNNRQTERKK
ncbi:MAG: DegV family protein [Eubacterium sp.]